MLTTDYTNIIERCVLVDEDNVALYFDSRFGTVIDPSELNEKYLKYSFTFNAK